MTAGSELQPCDLDDGEHVTCLIQPEIRQVAETELACDQRQAGRERTQRVRRVAAAAPATPVPQLHTLSQRVRTST